MQKSAAFDVDAPGSRRVVSILQGGQFVLDVATTPRARRTRFVVGAIVAVLATGALFVVPAGAGPRAAATKCADPSGTVKVGLSYFGGVGDNLNNIGASDASNLTPASQTIVNGYKAGVQALNDAGGLAGCQVSPVIFNFSASATDFNQESQKECATFTQDNKVIAVFTAGYETKVAVDCFAQAKVPLFQFGGSYVPTCADMTKNAGYVYAPITIATCRFGAFIPIYKKAGLFATDAKVGILVFDDGSGDGKALADKIWAPALKKLKIPSESFSFPGATSGAAFGATNSAMAAAILKFKSDGVNTVLFTPSASQAPAAFLPQALSQGYFPSYGLDSAEIGIATSIAPDAIKAGVGISWLPYVDLPLTAQQALPVNSAVVGCAPWSTPSTATLTGASGYCDFLNLLQAGFKNATKTDAASLKKGIEALGTSFVSSYTYGGATRFAKGHYDAVSMVQVLKYDPTTKSWSFKSANQKAIPVP